MLTEFLFLSACTHPTLIAPFAFMCDVSFSFLNRRVQRPFLHCHACMEEGSAGDGIWGMLLKKENAGNSVDGLWSWDGRHPRSFRVAVITKCWKKNYGDELPDASWMLGTIMPDGGSRFGSAQGSKGVLGPTHLLDCCDLWCKLGGYLLQSC